MGFLTAKQASELWGVSVRHIQDMCRNGKIRGAEKHGREWQTARLAAYGLSNKEIADRMGVTVNGVKQALRMVMNKIGAESRSDIGKYI